MTIAIDARELRTSTGRYVERLIHYLQQIDKDHDYIILLKPADMAGWKPTNPRFKVVACPYKEYTFSEQIGFRKQLNELKPDLVHFSMVQQPVFYGGRVVTTMHDLTTTRFRNPTKNWLVFTVKQQIYKWVNKRAAKRSKFVITPSDYVKKEIIEFAGVSGEKIVVTPEAADKISESAEPIQSLTGKEFIMYVGRPLPHKNLQRLIDAFAGVHKTYPQVELVLAGKFDSGYKLLQKYAKDKKLHPPLFPGFVKDSQLRWLYENARAYIFPSLSEGFGLPGLEAMQYGLPVVSSNATSLPEVYKDGAVYFDPTSTGDIADKIIQVLGDDKLAKNLAAKGSGIVKSYSWERMAKQTLDVYRSALGE